MRVISGQYGGRSLVSPPGHRTHPMGDRVKSALFNTLGDISGLSVLDAYAGSGALGIEALSRGAAFVQFVDYDAAAVDTIKQNLASLAVPDRLYRLTQANVTTWSKNNSQKRFDLLLIDPPYDSLDRRHIQQLAGHLKPKGLMVLSFIGREPAPTVNGVVVVDNKSYGNAALAYYRLDA